MLTPQLTGVTDNPTLPFASTLCGACYDVCPVAIDIPAMLVHLRSLVVADKAREEPVGRGEAAMMAGLAWAMRGRRRWTWALRATRLARVLARQGDRISRLPGPLAAWTASRDLPRPRRRASGIGGGGDERDRPGRGPQADPGRAVRWAARVPVPRDYYGPGAHAGMTWPVSSPAGWQTMAH